MKARLRELLPLLGALLLALLPFRDFFGTGIPVGRDLLFYFFPLKAHLVEAIGRGELPWVDRFRWGGSPLLGGLSAAPFDPANVLFLLLPLGGAMKAWILLHLAVALAGLAAFARRLGVPRAPAAVAGLVFALGGTAVSVATFPPTLSALSILPWFAAFVFDLVKAPRTREVAKVAIAAALILLATAPEFVLYAAFVAVAVSWAAWEEHSGWRGRARPLAALAISALVAGGLAAVSVIPGGATAARSSRSPESGRTFDKSSLKPFALARLADLASDGMIADWTVVATAPRIPDYPYLPSVTPGRVAWVLVLAGLVRKGPGRIAAALLALAGFLLALGDATPVFGLVRWVVPPLGWIRYPERHLILAGFGLAWLAALGLRRLAETVSPRALRVVLLLLAFAIFIDREGMARRLVPLDDASVIARVPALLSSLVPVAPGAPPPRLFFRDSYAPVPVYDLRDLESATRVGRQSLLPAYGSLFGVGYQFEVDYDLSLPLEAFEWSSLLSRAVRETPPLAQRLVRGVGVTAIVRSERGEDGRYRPRLERIVNPVPPYRFAGRLVASTDRRAVFKRLLEEGFPVDTAYADEAVPGVSAAPAAGRILAVDDRPSGLFLDVEVEGPGPGFLMLYRLWEAAEEATIDGRPARVSRVAFGFAGLAVPPGRHAVRLRPDTRWVKIGAMISAATALALATALLVPRRRPAFGNA